ncbi:zinc finger, CCHC-type containing protein [Tanacetum coccineum]
MGDENPIRTLGDYSKPSHEGYRNTIELPVGNNVVPLRSDTIRLVQNGCSFHGLRSEDPNQHLKDFLKLVDSLDLDGENRERTRLCLFQFSLRDQASNWLEHLPAGSISTWKDLTTRFLAQFFPPGRTAKLRNDILMFQQHHGESLSEAWTHFKDLLQKCEIDHAVGGKLRNKSTDESWEIIENLTLYDHEGWDETNDFVKPVKAIFAPHGAPKTPNRRLLELEDQINFLLKGSRPTPTLSSTHAPQAYVKAAYPNSHPQNEPPNLNAFAFHERTGLSPQPQALGTTFEAQVRDYMAAHTERMERFENSIFKQREEINGRMTEMFGLLKELTTSRAPEKVLIREEDKFPVTKNVNSISLADKDEERSDEIKETPDNTEKPPNLKWKHRQRSTTWGSVYDAILKKKITKKEDVAGNFKIPCIIGGLKHVNALVDQGSDVNVMPYSTYEKLTNERPVETDIRLSLASHSYIYPLGIAKNVLVEVAEHVYPADFVIMDTKENEKRPFILRTSFLMTAKASIKFDTCTITLRSGKSKISFSRITEPFSHVEKGIKNDIEPIAPTMTVNKLVLEWEERIRLHQENEMEYNQWRSKNFKDEHPALIGEEEGMEDEGKVT